MYLVLVLWQAAGHHFAEVALISMAILVQLLLQDILILFIGFLVEKIGFLHLLSSLNQHLPDIAGRNALVLHFIQLETLAVELLKTNLPIKLLGAEDEVPSLQRSTSGTLRLGLHMLGVYDRRLSCKLVSGVIINGDHSRPLIDQEVFRLIITTIGVVLVVVVGSPILVP